MLLRDVCNALELRLVRDANFQSLGLLSHRAPEMLVVLYDEKYIGLLIENPAISCVITREATISQLPPGLGIGVCNDPLKGFYDIHNYLLNSTDFYGFSPPSEIALTADIHPSAIVAATDVFIGAGTAVGAGAIVLSGTTLGRNVYLGPGVIVGEMGFEPKFVGDTHVLIRHAGRVCLEDGVEVLAGSHIAKAVFNGSTTIGAGTKIDALVHIAHNVKIGRNCEIAAGAVISGSCSIGDNVWIGPKALISSEVTVGDRAFIALGSVVTKNVLQDDRVFGVPARSIRRVSSDTEK
jgi:UDP-3-O-[3-hydroxymyristoyl] glucosamine N-acyltransferase